MGPVNMMALDEYKETAERHGFLETQRKDLIESIENTQETIKEIDQISRTKFDEALDADQREFRKGFCAALPGRPGVSARERRRKPGRERAGHRGFAAGQEAAKRAAAFGRRKGADGAWRCWWASSSSGPAPSACSTKWTRRWTKPTWAASPTCFDSLSHDTQFLIVTHSKRMMQAADMIYGVTMQEPGVSKIVSVRLGQHREAQRATA